MPDFQRSPKVAILPSTDEARARNIGKKAAQAIGKTFFDVIRLNGGGWCVRFDDNNYESRIFPDHKDTDNQALGALISNVQKLSN